jgi:hypothetical protein
MPLTNPSFKPTLFLVVGDMDPGDYQTLKDLTMERLDCTFTMDNIGSDRMIPAEGIGWDYLRRKDDLDTSRLDDALSQVLDTKYFQKWRQKGILPIVEGEPVTVQVVVVYHMTNPEDLPSLRSELDVVFKRLHEYFENRAFNLTLALLMLDNTPTAVVVNGLDASKLGFYPRFLMQRINCFGLNVDHRDYIQHASTLLVALASSDFVKAVQPSGLMKTTQDRISWLVVGAAAISSRMARMRAHFRFRLFAHLVEPLLVKSPSHDDELYLNGVAEHFLRGDIEGDQRIGLFLRLKAALANLRIWKNDRAAGGVTRESRMERVLDQHPTGAKQLREELTGFYLTFEQQSTLKSQEIVLQYKEEFLRLVRAFLLPERETRMPSQFPVDLPPDAPHGLGAATHVLRSLVTLISAAQTPQAEGLYLTGDEAVASVAEEDSLTMFRQQVAMHRSRRAVLSILMSIVFAFPVVPMVARAITTFSQVPPLTAFLLPLIVIGLIVAGELAYWLSLLAKERQQRQDVTERYVDGTLIRFSNRVLADSMRAVAVPINDLLYSLSQLSGKLEQAYRESTVELSAIERTLPVISGDQGAIYWLHNLPRCVEWSSLALKAIDQEEEFLPDLLDGILAGKTTSQTVMSELIKVIERQFADKFEMVVVQPLPIISADTKLTDLRDGKHLTWLDQRSAPLGMVFTGAEKFKFMIAYPDWLTGGLGEGNPNWPQGRVVSMGTLQPNEFICIQMFAMVND